MRSEYIPQQAQSETYNKRNMIAAQFGVEVASTAVVCHGCVEDIELRSHSESVIPILVKTHSRIDDRRALFTYLRR